MFKGILKILLPNQRLNRSLRVLIVSNTMMVFVLGMFAPFYAIFVQRLGGSLAFAGFLWAVFCIVTGVLTLLFCRWGLRVKEQELLVALGYLLRSLVFLSYAFMESIPQLIFTQVLWGIAAAIGTPAFDAIYASHTERDHSIVQWGQWEGVASIATGVAALMAGFLIESLGFQIVFLVMAAITTIIGIYIWVLPREVL
ncbi:MAG: MFS transporter [Candidatus Pacebacteria bacterium]|nr:MFS transporter [Candidatus Paceibacterota bacterium]